MNIASGRWFSEWDVMDDYNTVFQQNQMNFINTDDQVATLLQQGNHHHHHYNFQTSLSLEKSPTNTLSGSSVETCTKPRFERLKYSKKRIQLDHVSPKPSSSSSSSSHLVSFENSNSPQYSENKSQHQSNYRVNYFSSDSTLKPKKEAVSQYKNILFSPDLENQVVDYQKTKPNNIIGTKRCYSMTRFPSHAQDHIISERKRREKLTQCFIALSAIVPGLNKMDKASVLGDAIKYVKQLQEHVAILEEQTKKRTVESVVLIRKSQVSNDDGSSSCDENSDDQSLPEIEARISDKDVLIRIHCDKHKGFFVTLLSQVEKLGLFVVDSSVLPFGNSTLDITIIAQMENEFNMTVKDLVKNLCLALSKFK